MCRGAISSPARNSSARTRKRRAKPAKLARSLAIATYDQDPARLEQLRAKVENEVTELVAAKSLAKVDKLWESVPTAAGRGHARSRPPQEREQQYQKFRETLAAEGAWTSSRRR